MITVYTKPNCPYCDAAKAWLEHQSVPFATVDVMQDPNALAFLRAEGHTKVPQIYRGDTLAVTGGYTGLTQLNEAAIATLRQPV